MKILISLILLASFCCAQTTHTTASQEGNNAFTGNNTHTGTETFSTITTTGNQTVGGTLGVTSLTTSSNFCFHDNIAVVSASCFTHVSAAVAVLPAAGGYVQIAPNYTDTITCGVNQVSPGTKVVHFIGGGHSSIVSFTGCTAFTITANGTSFERFQILESAANSSSIAINIDNGTTGVTEWFIDHMKIAGVGLALGFGSIPSGSIGIRGNFALIANIRGSWITGWGTGVQLSGPDASHRSNAVLISGCDISGNITSLSYPTGVDDGTVIGNTIEASNVGVSIAGASGGKVTLETNHFEQTNGVNPTNVSLSGVGGTISAIGNGYFAGTANRDYLISAGLWNVDSYAETINEGITQNGTGVVTIYSSVTNPSITGTGQLYQIQGTLFKQAQPTANNAMFFAGYAFYTFDKAFKLTEIGSPAGTAGFDWLWADSSAHRLKTNPNNGGATTLAEFTDNLGVFASGGTVTPALYASATNCSNSAGTCGAAPAGAVTIAAAASTVTVATTAVTANSDISLTRNDALSTRLSVTCNTATAAGDIKVSTITPGTSFVITVQNAPAANPLCLTYSIVN